MIKISVQNKRWRGTIPDDQSEYSGASTQAWPNIYWDPTGNYLAWNGAFLSISKWCLPEHLLLSARLASQSYIKTSNIYTWASTIWMPQQFYSQSNIFIWSMAIWNQCYLANNAKCRVPRIGIISILWCWSSQLKTGYIYLYSCLKRQYFNIMLISITTEPFRKAG